MFLVGMFQHHCLFSSSLSFFSNIVIFYHHCHVSTFFVVLTSLGCFYGWQIKKTKKKLDTSRLCVSSLRRGHANLLCIVPILTDGYKVTEKWGCLGVNEGDFENRKIWLWDLHDFFVFFFFLIFDDSAPFFKKTVIISSSPRCLTSEFRGDRGRGRSYLAKK